VWRHECLCTGLLSECLHFVCYNHSSQSCLHECMSVFCHRQILYYLSAFIRVLNFVACPAFHSQPFYYICSRDVFYFLLLLVIWDMIICHSSPDSRGMNVRE
ncbi:unnamed protein product, partial [Scytosiphon promiscuus]